MENLKDLNKKDLLKRAEELKEERDHLLNKYNEAKISELSLLTNKMCKELDELKEAHDKHKRSPKERIKKTLTNIKKRANRVKYKWVE